MRPDSARRRSRSGTWIAFVTILGAAAAFRLALVALLRNKQTHDVQVFVSWAQLLARYGNHGLYHHVDTIDHYSVNYPPLFIIVLDVVDAVYLRLVPHGGENVVLLGMLLKIPAIVADLAICCIVFVVIRRWSRSAAALVAVAIAAFAPSTWPISAVWGQVDSICTSFLMAALALTFERKYTLAWSALALAILVKPLPIVLAPLLLMVQFRDRRWSWGLIAGPACAIVIAYVVSLPFAPTVSLVGVLSWLAGSYASGQSLTDATSVNAYNVWTLWWLVTPDSRLLLGLRLHAWGWLAFAAIAVAVIWRLSRRLAAESDRVLREQLITRASFIMLVALFMFATRMHERYILYALTLVPLMWFCGRSERWTAVTLLVTFTLCVILVLGFYEHDRFHEIPIVTHLLSLVNLVALFVVLRSFFSGPSDGRRDRQFVQRRTSSRTVAS